MQQFTGHVFDQTGAGVGNAKVTARNQGTNVEYSTKTTTVGAYTIPYLPLGVYSIKVEMPGFETLTKTDITLNVDQTSTIDFKLAIGKQSMVVDVSASGQQIELSKSDRGEIVDVERIREMPFDGLNPLTLFSLSPGTHDFSNPIYPRPFDNVNSNLYANGAPQQPSVSLDGVSNDSNVGGANGYVPAVDSVQEYKVILNPYDASYGKAAARRSIWRSSPAQTIFTEQFMSTCAEPDWMLIVGRTITIKIQNRRRSATNLALRADGLYGFHDFITDKIRPFLPSLTKR